MRSRGDLKVSMPTIVEDGDYVVPESNELGKQHEQGVILGNEKKVSKLAMAIARHASNHGGHIQPKPQPKAVKPAKNAKIKIGKPAKAKKEKVVEPEVEEEEIAYIKPNIQIRETFEKDPTTVTFQNKFGKIKLSCEDVLEEEQAICLVFASDDEVRFTPEQGEELYLTVSGGSKTKVFFPGVIFTWSDGQKRLMVLFRANEG